MLLSQAVLSGAVEQGRAVFRFIFGNHCLAAAAVACQAVRCQRIIRPDNAKLNEGIDCGNKACGMAAGVGNALCMSDFFLMQRGKLRKAIYPIGICAVGCTCVNNAGVRVFHQLDCLFCRIIRQTEKNNLCLVHQSFSLCLILSQILAD